MKHNFARNTGCIQNVCSLTLKCWCNYNGIPYYYIFQQMQWLLLMPTLVLALAPSSWMRLAAVAMKANLLTALEALRSDALEATQRMLEYDVKV